MALLERIAAGNLEYKLQKQITRLQNESQAVEIQIDRQRFLIRKLDPTMAEGLLTKREAKDKHIEIHFVHDQEYRYIQQMLE